MFLKEFSKVLSKSILHPALSIDADVSTETKLGKELVGFPTEDFVVITYEYQEDMIFGGTFDPAFRLQAVSDTAPLSVSD